MEHQVKSHHDEEAVVCVCERESVCVRVCVRERDCGWSVLSRGVAKRERIFGFRLGAPRDPGFSNHTRGAYCLMPDGGACRL